MSCYNNYLFVSYYLPIKDRDSNSSYVIVSLSQMKCWPCETKYPWLFLFRNAFFQVDNRPDDLFILSFEVIFLPSSIFAHWPQNLSIQNPRTRSTPFNFKHISGFISIVILISFPPNIQVKMINFITLKISFISLSCLFNERIISFS